MKIICLVKVTPDIDQIEYDYEDNVLIRDSVKSVINPDDACALGFALGLKKKYSDIEIEVVTMGPLSVSDLLKDILRRKIDRATLLSDRSFVGSDTYSTSLILGRYLEMTSYDVILTGSHSLDGDTSHVPAQLAEYLKLPQLSYIRKIDEQSFLEKCPIVEVETEYSLDTYELSFPAILSLSKESNYRLPFIRFADLDLDVDEFFKVMDNDDLKVDPSKIGLRGSPTQVIKTYTYEYENKEKQVVQTDDEGIETVYQFLKEEGYLS